MIYLDAHATTPVDPAVREAMAPYLEQEFGNSASKGHAFGWRAEAAVEQARARVAALLGASPPEIIFTSGATEANHIAILGVAAAAPQPGHLVTSGIEHRAVLDQASALEARGWAITRVSPRPSGLIDPADVAAALRPDTRLVSVMAVNSEIGTIQPVQDIAGLCAERGVLFHCDAAQILGRISIDVSRSPCDLITLSAHKGYGPKGAGALFIRGGPPRSWISPVLFGGGQEGGLRPGTLPVADLVGMGRACELARTRAAEDERGIRALRERLWFALQRSFPGARLNGDPQRRVAGNLNVELPGIEAEAIIERVGAGLAISAGSACSSASQRPSPVLLALGLSPRQALSSLRLGLTRLTTAQEIDQAVVMLHDATRDLPRVAIPGDWAEI